MNITIFSLTCVTAFALLHSNAEAQTGPPIVNSDGSIAAALGGPRSSPNAGEDVAYITGEGMRHRADINSPSRSVAPIFDLPGRAATSMVDATDPATRAECFALRLRIHALEKSVFNGERHDDGLVGSEASPEPSLHDNSESRRQRFFETRLASIEDKLNGKASKGPIPDAYFKKPVTERLDELELRTSQLFAFVPAAERSRVAKIRTEGPLADIEATKKSLEPLPRVNLVDQLLLASLKKRIEALESNAWPLSKSVNPSEASSDSLREFIELTLRLQTKRKIIAIGFFAIVIILYIYLINQSKVHAFVSHKWKGAQA